MSSSGYGDPPLVHCQAFPGNFHTFAQMQPFCFTSSWFTLTKLLFILLCGVSLWNVLCPHKDETEVGLLWFTFGGKTAGNLYLSSTWHIKSMGRFAACSMLLNVSRISTSLEGWIGKQQALKQQKNTVWNRLRLLLSAWSVASGGTRRSWASLASADASQEMNIVEERAQIFNKFMTQFIHFYYSSGYCYNVVCVTMFLEMALSLFALSAVLFGQYFSWYFGHLS